MGRKIVLRKTTKPKSLTLPDEANGAALSVVLQKMGHECRYPSQDLCAVHPLCFPLIAGEDTGV